MRKLQLIIFSLLFLSSAIHSQESHVTLLGRWGKGESEAVFHRGGFTFVGNGAYLEVFQNQQGTYQSLDKILLPGAVQDIWVQGDITNVYVACGDQGLQVVYFNNLTATFSGIIGTLDTPGFAQGVMQYGSHLYVGIFPQIILEEFCLFLCCSLKLEFLFLNRVERLCDRDFRSCRGVLDAKLCYLSICLLVSFGYLRIGNK